jgi:hypothetical protein
MEFSHIYLLHFFKENIAQIIIIGEPKIVSTHPWRSSEKRTREEKQWGFGHKVMYWCKQEH